MSASTDSNVCDENVYSSLFQEHARDLHRFLYYKYGAENNPEDLVQEAFTKLWKNCANVPHEKARSFLFTVASNQMLNDLAKKKTALTYGQQDHKGYTTESPEHVMEQQQYMEALQQAINDLTEEQRVTFLLNRIEGKKHKEIAEMLGISRKTVEKRIYTALAKIMERVGKI